MKAPMRLTAATLLFLLAGCATTRVVDSWKEPSAGPISFQKVLVIVMSADESIRRTAEDELVKHVKKATAVPSYSVLNSADLKSLDTVKSKIASEGFDGVVTMRLVGKEKETTYVPGSYPSTYYNFSGYYGYSAAFAYDPGYYQTSTILRVETNVYSVKDEKLIWSGLSETVEPSGARQLASEVAVAVAQEMKTQKMIK